MNKKNIIITIVVVILCAGLFLSYKKITDTYRKNLEEVRLQEKDAWKKKVDSLTDKVNSLEKEISNLSGTGSPEMAPKEEAKEGGIQGKAAKTSGEPVKIDDVERSIASFFLHLDDEDYIKKFNLKGSTYNEYEKIIVKLSRKPPLIGSETASMYNMFVNLAHFYRVLGKKDLFLIKDVLTSEGNSIESIMKDFYIWYTSEPQKDKVKGIPSFKVLYDYSSYFLDTIGGRSYLMRRDSEIRLLVTYYSVLILDRANELKKNSNGIDIRPFIRLLNMDIPAYSGLKYQKEYMNTLAELSTKYGLE